MANLGPLQQNLTYGNLLQVDGGLSSTLQPVLDGDGNASGLSLSLTGVGISGLVADSAANLYAGSTGALPYQISANNTGFVAAGVVGQLLASNGLAAPTWTTVTPATLGALASNGSIAMTGNLAMGSHKITGLLTPSADTDAATKAYVDSLATGLQVKAACRLATTTNLASLTGPATVDGIAVATGDRILVKSQTAEAENGIYVANVSTSPLGLWTRATDADTWGELVGAATFITAGDTLANTTWVSNTTAGGTLGTTDIEFVLFGASAAYSAGTGLTLVGSQFSLSTPVSLANGGTGATSAASALNVLLPAQSGYSGRYLTTDGTNATWGVVTPYDPSSVAITGGTINGVTIGGSLPLAGSFTNLTTTTSSSLNGFITTNNTAAFLRTPRIWDDSQTHWYRITPSELALDVYSTLPALTGNDTFVFQNHTQTLTNKTISGASNTLTNIGNAALTNSSITINGTAVSLGGSISVGGGGTVTSVALTAPTGLTVSGSPVTSSGTLALSLQSGYSIPTTAKQAEWDTAFAVRYRWDGGSTGLVPATGRSSLGLGNIATISTTGSTTNFLRADGTWAAPAGGSMYYNVKDYGAVGNGFTDDTAAINATITAAGAGGTIFIPAGTYLTSSTINLTDINVIGVGTKTILRGISASLGATNPMFKLAKICTVQNLYAEFDVKPTTATTGQYVIFQCGNPAVTFGELQRYSYINGVATGKCGTAFYNPSSTQVFSTTFSNLRIEDFKYRGFDFNSNYRTGNVYENIYIAGGDGNTVNALFALQGNESECSIIQLNAEHCNFSQAALIFNGCNAITVTSLHLEALKPASNNLPFVYTNSSSGTFESFVILGNYSINPTTTGNTIFQCNSSYNTYGGTNNTLTANYFRFGVFYVANIPTTTSWTMVSRGTNDGAMYVEVGGYQYTPNNSFYYTFPTSGNVTLTNNGYNVTSPSQTVPGTLTVGTNVPTVSMLKIGTTTASTYTSVSMLSKYPTTSAYVWAMGPVVDDFYITQNSGSYFGVKLTWGATSWTAASDETTKDIIEPISNALETVNGLRSVIGKFKTDEEGTRRSFLIAQDFEQAFPEAVDHTMMGDDEILGLRYQDVIPLLVAAIKELSAKVDALENNNG